MYKLTAFMPHFEYSKFKQKQAIIIKSLIEQARLGKIFKFEGWGEITFEDGDEQHWSPIVNIIPDFNRNKVNAIVWGINKSEIREECEWDKCIITQEYYATQKTGYYSLFFLNSKTGHCTHHYGISYEYDKITYDMQYTIDIVNDGPMLQKEFAKNKMLNDMLKKRKAA